LPLFLYKNATKIPLIHTLTQIYNKLTLATLAFNFTQKCYKNIFHIHFDPNLQLTDTHQRKEHMHNIFAHNDHKINLKLYHKATMLSVC
jgi:hypothetical protein